MRGSRGEGERELRRRRIIFIVFIEYLEHQKLLMTQHDLQTVLESSRREGGKRERGRGLKRQQEGQGGKAKMFFGDYKFSRRQAAAVPAAVASAFACSSVAVILSYTPSPHLPLRTLLPQ